jgi:hypothetical protein
MKTLGMLAVLLFVTAMAMGQNAVPFPQGANPALENGSYVPAVVDTPQNMPSSMAANVGDATISYRSDRIDAGSPFPMDANPSLEKGTVAQEPFLGERHPGIDTGSPFPTAADPNR